MGEKTEEKRQKKRMLFWNIAGLGGISMEFWKYMEVFQFVGLVG